MEGTVPSGLSELVERGLLTPPQAREAADIAAREGKPLTEVLVARGFVPERMLIGLMAHELQIPPIDLDRLSLPEEIFHWLPREKAERHHVLPISHSGNVLTVAMGNPHDMFALDQLRLATPDLLRPVASTPGAIRRAMGAILDDDVHPRRPEPVVLSIREPAPEPVLTARARLDLEEQLLEDGRIDELQLAGVRTRRVLTGEPLEEALVGQGCLAEHEVACFLAELWGLPYLDASTYAIDPSMSLLMPLEEMAKNRLVILDRMGSAMIVAICSLASPDVYERLARVTASEIHFFVATRTAVFDSIHRMSHETWSPLPAAVEA